MRTSLVVLAAALGLADAASHMMLSPYASLNKRQGEAFDPDETTAPGENCVDAFGSGYVECVPATLTSPRLCINPELGDTCCDGLWGCPTDSFCLVQDLCCPTGLDPETCAAANDVTLPPDFGTTPTTTAPPVESTEEPEADDTTTDEPEETTTETATTTRAPTTTTRAPTGNGTTTTRATTTSTRTVETGAAHHPTAGVAAAAVLGLAAAIVL